MARPETRRTSEANQRAPLEHVMSAAVTYATRKPTIPHGNLTDICHSIQVLSDPKAKYNSQRYHDLLNSALLHLDLHLCCITVDNRVVIIVI